MCGREVTRSASHCSAPQFAVRGVERHHAARISMNLEVFRGDTALAHSDDDAPVHNDWTREGAIPPREVCQHLYLVRCSSDEIAHTLRCRKGLRRRLSK